MDLGAPSSSACGPPAGGVQGGIREAGADDGWDFAMGLLEISPKPIMPGLGIARAADAATTACTACLPGGRCEPNLNRNTACTSRSGHRWEPSLNACVPRRVRFAPTGQLVSECFPPRMRSASKPESARNFGSRFRPFDPDGMSDESMNLLAEADEPPELMPLQVGRPFKPEFAGYTKVQVAIDSGAAASVMPEALLDGHRILPSDGSRKGIQYLAADGGRIPNLGEVHLGFITKEQHRCRITFQVANVKRPLLAVGTLTKAGNDVHFTTDGGTIVNRRTKRVISFHKVDGIYVLELLMGPGPAGTGSDGWQTVKGKRAAPAKAAPGRGFTRPGP